MIAHVPVNRNPVESDSPSIANERNLPSRDALPQSVLGHASVRGRFGDPHVPPMEAQVVSHVMS
ncbi:MAG TPA: hypothetical protein VGY57_14935 [Vicinamibacterales bacterium]|jgi:hypothetical protein|nr:hypothetical protein [Vicinamibacterales bacterium]